MRTRATQAQVADLGEVGARRRGPDQHLRSAEERGSEAEEPRRRIPPTAQGASLGGPRPSLIRRPGSRSGRSSGLVFSSASSRVLFLRWPPRGCFSAGLLAVSLLHLQAAVSSSSRRRGPSPSLLASFPCPLSPRCARGRRSSMPQVCGSVDVAVRVESQLKLVIRPMYSIPPLHGPSIVMTILKDSEMYNEWNVELEAMADIIISMRQQLFDVLKSRVGINCDWVED